MNEQQPHRSEQHDEDDVAPGAVTFEEARPRGAIISYVIGLVASVLLTGASFWLLGTKLVWGPAIPVAMVAFAVAQIGVHLVFFLHITTAPDNTNNILALAFGILIVALVVAGSIWIMNHLDENMLPTDQMHQMQR